MIAILLMLLVGIFLSAFFSGSETGFYRVTRVRLVLDAIGGNIIARGLLWLTNNPSLFIATALIGNNLANYLLSLAMVLAIDHLYSGPSQLPEVIVPILLSPLVFVYGELLPKNLFFNAPNLLLRRTGPLFLLFVLLLAPLVAVLWALGRGLQSLAGQAPAQVRLTLARKELQQVLEEGHEAGILKPAQRVLAQSLFAVASQSVVNFATPVERVASIRLGTPLAEVQRLARRHRVSAIPVTEARGRRLVGYVRVIDLYLKEPATIQTVRPLLEISSHEPHGNALIRMQTGKEQLARVVDGQGNTLGLLYLSRLTAPLFRGA